MRKRTYGRNGSLTFGGIVARDGRSGGNVPDQIWPLLQQPIRVVLTVKQAA
jgi:hypothetical protein